MGRIRSYSASRYISYRNLVKLNEADRKKIEKELDEKVKSQIEESDDPIDKTVNRKWITNVMVKLERIARPVVKEQNGYDITKIFK